MVILSLPSIPPQPLKKVLNFKSSIFSPTKKNQFISLILQFWLCHRVSSTNVVIGLFALNFSHQQFIRSKEEINFLRFTDGSFHKNFKNSSYQGFIKQQKWISIKTKRNIFVLVRSSENKHQRDYRLIDVCFHKNLEIHVRNSISKKQKHSGFIKRKILLFWCSNHAKVINMIIGS